MNGCPVSFPVRYGTGLQRVSLYAPTIALPYYRITYRTGGKCLQRTYTCFDKADREARAIADKLALGEVSVAQINSSEVVQLRAAQEHLAPLGIRVDAAAGEYAALSSKLGTVSLDRAVDFYLLNNNPKLNKFRLVHLVEQFLDFKKAIGVSAVFAGSKFIGKGSMPTSRNAVKFFAALFDKLTGSSTQAKSIRISDKRATFQIENLALNVL